ANPSTSPRTVHITVTGTGEITESSSMTITQQGAAPSLDVSPNSKEVGYETGSTVFDVASTVGWNVTDEASWLTATKTDGSTISVVYEANSATTSRSANITATGTGGLTETVSLTQAGTPYINIDPNSYEVGYFGGTEYINIVSNVEWTASSDAAWLGPTKEGNDLVVYHDENRIAIPRTGLITITGTGGISENVTINQAALEVELDIGDPEENVGPESGTLRHYIETNSYLWTVSAQADWLKASRINEGRINVTYEANPSTVPRSTSIIVDATGGVSGEFKVIQAGAVASLDVDPNSKEVSAESGTVTCNVNSNVDWSVYENATWLTATKTDESTITINYNTNLSTSVRIAVVTAEGKEGLSEMVAVTQAGAAVSIEVDPLSESVDAVSGTLTFSVNANVDWSVSDDAAWLTAVKSDETTINVSYEANTSDNPRIATITIEEPGGITVTVSVTQSGETITMDVSPKNISVSPISGTTDFSVNSNVEWNVSHDASWLTTAKTDTTTISVSYEANTSTSPRTAGITVEGTSGVTETVTVTQAGEEVILEVSPLSENLDASSGTTTFDVNSNVEWNVTDEASWFTAVKSDETTINVSYDANTTTTSRTASITVTGTGGVTVTVTITQVGAEAYLEVHPDGESVDAASGNVIFNVQANGEWNITDDASWVTVSKQNDTTILVSYEANADLIPRIAHIIVQGTGGAIATVTVTQASETITFDVSPKNQHVEASSGNISYVIDSNIDWGVSVNDSWLTVVRLDENTIGVNYDANPGINERIAYFLVFGTGGITETVTLTQAGEVPYLEVDPLTMNFGSASDSTSFTIRSNVEWSLVEDADWLSTALSGDTLLIVYSDENPGVEGRSASIVFSGDGVTSQIVTIVQAGTGSTGIMDPDVPVQFTVYPNPSHEMIYIRSSADLETGMMLSLFDASGKLMFARNVEYMVSGETIQIDISAMYPGVYILRLYHAGSISIIKVIKR
ncbi:MAG: BACON domain-containing carbohydrate-binding protein, partial [Bacteroidota bacterium]